jgi:hypothetical protein
MRVKRRSATIIAMAVTGFGLVGGLVAALAGITPTGATTAGVASAAAVPAKATSTEAIAVQGKAQGVTRKSYKCKSPKGQRINLSYRPGTISNFGYLT